MQILNDFGVNWMLLAAQVVNFTILLLILNRFVYKPVIKLLEERKAKIAESLANAKKIEDRLDKLEVDRAKVIQEAKDESKKIITEARSIADTIKTEADKDAAKRLEAAIKKAESASEARLATLQKEIKQDVVRLVVETLRVTTGKVLSEDDQHKILEKEVASLSKLSATQEKS